MLALFFLVQDPQTTSADAMQPSADYAVPLDWAGPAARRPGADENVQNFDPSAAVISSPDMCVIVAGQPIPACANAPAQHLTLSDDLFNNASVNPDSTCQTIETIRRGDDGSPRRFFATYCGEELSRNDYRETRTPSGSAVAARPTDRDIGPNEILGPPATN